MLRLVFAIILAAVAAEAAPLSPFGPVDICGEVVSSQWREARVVAGRPGFSGSLGHDRTFPARFGVVLRNQRGLDPARVTWVNGALGGAAGSPDVPAGGLVILVNSDDPKLLDGARALCVDAFVIRGDEGGTWVRHGAVKVRR